MKSLFKQSLLIVATLALVAGCGHKGEKASPNAQGSVVEPPVAPVSATISGSTFHGQFEEIDLTAEDSSNWAGSIGTTTNPNVSAETPKHKVEVAFVQINDSRIRMEVSFPKEPTRAPEAYFLNAKAEGFELVGKRMVIAKDDEVTRYNPNYESPWYKFWDWTWPFFWRMEKEQGDGRPMFRYTDANLKLSLENEGTVISGSIGFVDGDTRKVYNVSISRYVATEEPAKSTEGSDESADKTTEGSK